MPDIVVIPAAGWKCGITSSKLPGGALDPRLPEILWPLADGNTIIERTIKQLHSLGIPRVVVGVGHPDNYPTMVHENRISSRRNGYRCDGRGCPWTWERVNQVESYGAETFLLDNPLEHSCQVSMYRMMKHIEDWEWGRVLGMAGDYLFKTGFLRDIVEEVAWPSMHWILPVHDMLFLDRVGHRIFVDFVQDRPVPYSLSGNGLWRARERLADDGLPSVLVPDSEWKAYACGHTGARLPVDRDIRFAEVGIGIADWGAAQILAAEEPV